MTFECVLIFQQTPVPVRIPREFPYDVLQSSVKVRFRAFDRATEAIEQMDGKYCTEKSCN